MIDRHRQSESVVIAGGRVVDGTGSAAFDGDVLLRGGRVAAIGDLGEVDAAVVDARGSVVCPGFIDVHTHLDAQVLWDPDLSPSSSHGVTTVVVGNCGFGLAPTPASGRRVIAETLEIVEGIPADVIEAAVDWSFETFPEYLDVVRQRPLRCNFSAFVGHTPLRLQVMGMDAYERPADAAETEMIAALAREAVEAGALGFATSFGRPHVGIGGRPVPSRLARRDEMSAIFRAVADISSLNQVNLGPGLELDDLLAVVDELGMPVTYTSLTTGHRSRDALFDELEYAVGGSRRIWPQMACRPIVMQVSMRDPYPFAWLPGMDAVVTASAAQRADVYRSLREEPGWLDALDAGWADRWHRVSVQETGAATEHIGRPLDELAAELGVSPAALLVDVALADDLATRFRVVLANDDEPTIGELLADDRPILGLSDAGAHMDQLCA